MFNRARLEKFKDEAGLDVLILTLPENVAYLTGYSNPLEKYFPDLVEYVVLVQDQIILLIPGVNAGFCIGNKLTVTQIIIYGKFVIAQTPPFHTAEEGNYAELINQSNKHPSAVSVIQQILSDYGFSGGRIGIDGLGYSQPAFSELSQAIPQATLIDSTVLMKLARAVKTPQEIDRLYAAARVNEAAYGAMCDATSPGVLTSEIMKAYRMKIAELGGEFAFSSTGSGVLGGGPWLDTQLMRLKEGDAIRFDGVMRYQNYWADFGRTLVLKQVSRQVQATYDALMDGYHAALGLIRAGAVVADIFYAGLNTVRQSGLPNYDRHHIGHGIGLHAYDYPVISPNPGSMYSTENDEATLEAGMVLCIELPLFHLGIGGWQIEDTLIVTETGFQYITSLSQDIHICG